MTAYKAVANHMYVVNVQAYLEHGIPNGPEMVVTLMQKARFSLKLMMFCSFTSIKLMKITVWYHR